MIVGIGCDIVRINRMNKLIPIFKQGMKQHILSAFEQKELTGKDFNDDQISRFLAKRFAAKEALSKALGTGFREGMYLKDITIHHNDMGKPFFEVEGGVLETLLKKTNNQDFKIHLSLSDEADLAQAFVIVELL
ncbi:MAG: holo-ACP synthase [Alphaproteobacteria bacterium]|nr:holo-ACP synthase [Alphaproteobacteria bacterium]